MLEIVIIKFFFYEKFKCLGSAAVHYYFVGIVSNGKGT